MARIDLSTYLAEDTLDLDGIPSTKHPEGGSYKIPSLSGEDGLLLQVITAGADGRGNIRGPEAAEALAKFCLDPDGKAIPLERKLFGPALDEMLADGVSNTRLELVMQVVMTQASLGTEVARQFVARASGEAGARANRATRRAATKAVAKKAPAKKPASSPRKAGSKSPQTSGAKSTPRARASTRGSAASPPPQAKTG